MKQLNRYQLDISNVDYKYPLEMAEDPDGDYVLYDDVKSLDAAFSILIRWLSPKALAEIRATNKRAAYVIDKRLTQILREGE